MTVEHHCDRETVVKKVVVNLLRFRTHRIFLDYGVATDFCSRIGMDRSLEIRHAIEQNMKLTVRSTLTEGSHPPSDLKLNPK
jgi:hypothetical protein